MAKYKIVVSNADTINPRHKLRNDEPEANAGVLFDDLMGTKHHDWDEEKVGWKDVPAYVSKYYLNWVTALAYYNMLVREFPNLHILLYVENGPPPRVMREGGTWQESPPAREHLPEDHAFWYLPHAPFDSEAKKRGLDKPAHV